jgi:hypothetical protein
VARSSAAQFDMRALYELCSRGVRYGIKVNSMPHDHVVLQKLAHTNASLTAKWYSGDAARGAADRIERLLGWMPMQLLERLRERPLERQLERMLERRRERPMQSN